MDQELWHNFSMRDPKHYSNDELDRAIDEYWNGVKLKILYDCFSHTPRRMITMGELRKRQKIDKKRPGSDPVLSFEI